MPKVKVPRKSTSVDMTAMCDVAFLLLSFFILTTSFKPDEALAVTTPKSVQTKTAETNDVALVTIDKEGKVYFSISDDNREEKQKTIDIVNEQRKLGLTDAEKKAFLRAGAFVGVPFNQLKSYLALNPDQAKTAKQSGIPVTDTLNNEMVTWIGAAKSAFEGSKMNLMVKGDQNSLYTSFKGVIDAFKKNDELKFQTITDPENVPIGSDLYNTNARRGATQEQK
ncbi:MAG: biopolymer transporter ExbD [Chitinophagaceae bacterium]|nr:MAG: biopolymer transporter ExbD [Chitinophagaceae bacterium]